MRSAQKRSVTGELAWHFFRRFFDNDVLQADGETWTTMARALAIVATPGLMFAFFLQNSYPQRTAWGRIEDQYFFVLFSFVVMAGVSLFEWEMLFPERIDFLVMASLPLRKGQLLCAKVSALGALLGFFLLACNGSGVLLLPMVSRDVFWRMVWAQGVAVAAAGLFGGGAVMTLGGLLLCVLPARIFRRLSPVLQMLAVAVLTLLVIQYARYGDQMEVLVKHGGRAVTWLPTLWFLGVYQELLHGDAAAAFARPAARQAWAALAVVAVSAVLLYPLAWTRMQRLAVQGEVLPKRRRSRTTRSRRTGLVQTQTERAIFSFIGKTMSRDSRYQVYLAIYSGVGLALAVACGLRLQSADGSLQPRPSVFGMQAVLPLLLFWTVAGLHMAFAVPQNLPARWLFRTTTVDPQACARATRRWVTLCGGLVVASVLLLLSALGWGWKAVLVQAVWGFCFCGILVQGFFVGQRGAPFTRPRAPAKTSLPAVLTLYLGVLPPVLFGVAWAEARASHHLVELLWPTAAWGAMTVLMRSTRQHLVWLGEESYESADGEIQLLGLAGELRT